jgi:hypothetical protein
LKAPLPGKIMQGGIAGVIETGAIETGIFETGTFDPD